MARIKLSEWAKNNGISYQTAWNWFKSNQLPVEAFQSESGTILVEEAQNRKSNEVVIYARVSSSNKKQDLIAQLSLCEEFCISNGWTIQKNYKEIASGMNDNRRILNKILDDPPSRLVVLHKDRLTRFGFNYLEKLLAQLDCEVVVINRDKEDEDDILKDFIAIITSFCCRLYGTRRGQAKALKMKENLRD